jgi:hypothetical protein
MHVGGLNADFTNTSVNSGQLQLDADQNSNAMTHRRNLST